VVCIRPCICGSRLVPRFAPLTRSTCTDAILRDMGTHGSPPTRVLEVPIKWTRPVRSPVDLQVGPKTLFMTPTTLEDLDDLI
jgi:hypothetical protein